jgi:hypothetical protein
MQYTDEQIADAIHSAGSNAEAGKLKIKIPKELRE